MSTVGGRIVDENAAARPKSERPSRKQVSKEVKERVRRILEEDKEALEALAKTPDATRANA
jgi:hypothetical protein